MSGGLATSRAVICCFLPTMPHEPRCAGYHYLLKSTHVFACALGLCGYFPRCLANICVSFFGFWWEISGKCPAICPISCQFWGNIPQFHVSADFVRSGKCPRHFPGCKVTQATWPMSRTFLKFPQHLILANIPDMSLTSALPKLAQFRSFALFSVQLFNIFFVICVKAMALLCVGCILKAAGLYIDTTRLLELTRGIPHAFKLASNVLLPCPYPSLFSTFSHSAYMMRVPVRPMVYKL
eukprot:4114127-Pleurochrysis_carterae.AAC.2